MFTGNNFEMIFVKLQSMEFYISIISFLQACALKIFEICYLDSALEYLMYGIYCIQSTYIQDYNSNLATIFEIVF